MSMATEDQYHVLAVDDSLIDRKLIERLLRTSSYQVTTVDSGSKALEFLRILDDQANPTSVSPQHHHHEVEVNLIITDYCMPGMTGYDLLKRIKGSSTFKDIPVVVMSSENVPSRINRCLEGGAEEFFLKPLQLSDLKRLRPHILKGKLKEQQQQEQQQGLHQQQQEQQQHPIKANTNVSTTSNSSTTTTTSNTSTNTNSNSSNSSNKRKAMDEGLSPERTRQRFTTSSLTVV